MSKTLLSLVGDRLQIMVRIKIRMASEFLAIRIKTNEQKKPTSLFLPVATNLSQDSFLSFCGFVF